MKLQFILFSSENLPHEAYKTGQYWSDIELLDRKTFGPQQKAFKQKAPSHPQEKQRGKLTAENWIIVLALQRAIKSPPSVTNFVCSLALLR